MPEETQVVETQEQPSLAPKRDFRQEVTNQIIEMLEKGTARGRNRGNREPCDCRSTPQLTAHIAAAMHSISWELRPKRASTIRDG